MDNFFYKNMKIISPPYTYFLPHSNNIYNKITLLRNSLHPDIVKTIPIVKINDSNYNFIKNNCIIDADQFILQNINHNIKIIRDLITDLNHKGIIIGFLLQNTLFFNYFFDLISFVAVDSKNIENNYKLISNFKLPYLIISNNNDEIAKYKELIKQKNKFVGIDTDGKIILYENNCNPNCLNY